MADTPLVRGVFSERCAAAALRDMAKRLQAMVVVVDRKEGREIGREGRSSRRKERARRDEYLCGRWGTIAAMIA